MDNKNINCFFYQIKKNRWKFEPLVWNTLLKVIKELHLNYKKITK